MVLNAMLEFFYKSYKSVLEDLAPDYKDYKSIDCKCSCIKDVSDAVEKFYNPYKGAEIYICRNTDGKIGAVYHNEKIYFTSQIDCGDSEDPTCWIRMDIDVKGVSGVKPNMSHMELGYITHNKRLLNYIYERQEYHGADREVHLIQNIYRDCKDILKDLAPDYKDYKSIDCVCFCIKDVIDAVRQHYDGLEK